MVGHSRALTASDLLALHTVMPSLMALFFFFFFFLFSFFFFLFSVFRRSSFLVLYFLFFSSVFFPFFLFLTETMGGYLSILAKIKWYISPTLQNSY